MPTSQSVFTVPVSGFEVVADCVDSAAIKDHSHDGVDLGGFGPQRLIVDVIHDRKSKAWSWRVWIAYPGAAHLGSLDNAGICRACGKEILDAVVTPEGRILVAH